MKILSSEKIKRIENEAVKAGISMETLMQNAGKAVFNNAKKMLDDIAHDKATQSPKAVILCGKGNNGGDGFVCSAELMKYAEVTVILTSGAPTSELAASAFDKMKSVGKDIKIVDVAEDLNEAEIEVKSADLIIDGIYGFGFRGKLSGNELKIIELANKSRAKKLSIDIPSGAECDTARADGVAFKAELTVTFSALKPACVSYPAREYFGEIIVENVGIPWDIIAKEESDIFIADDEYIRGNLPTLNKDSNKGSVGKLLLVCGSYGMAGACIMSAKAALKAGVGLLYIAVPKSIYAIVASEIAEAVFVVYDLDNEREKSFKKLENAIEMTDACVIGCGLGELANELCDFIFERAQSIVVDADALNYISRNSESAERLSLNAVLTPHPGELSRLTGDSIGEIQSDRLCTADREGKRLDRVLLLKGASTVISNRGEATAVNLTGNAGMAKGGSGDVLSGIIGVMLSQGLNNFDAAITGAYIHGVAGDIAAQKLTERAMQATDLIFEIPSAYKKIFGKV